MISPLFYRFVRHFALLFGSLFVGLLYASGTALAAYGDVGTALSKVYPDTREADELFVDFPEGMVSDGASTFFLADTYNNVIRSWNRSTGHVQTVAGTGSYGQIDGTTSASEFSWPKDIARDAGGALYVADTHNNAIRKIQNGRVSTILRDIQAPEGVFVVGNRLYIAASGEGAIYRTRLDGSDKTRLTTGLSQPTKLTSKDEWLYVSETGRHRIQKIHRSTGQKQVLAGGASTSKDGTGSGAGFRYPYGLTISGNTLYVAEDTSYNLEKIRAVDLSTKEVTTLFEERLGRTLRRVHDVEAIDGNLFALSRESRIHRFDLNDPEGDNEIVASSDFFNDQTGTGSQALVGRPYDLLFTKDKKTLYIAANNKIRKLRLSDKRLSHVIGRSVDNYIEGTDAEDVAFSVVSGMALSPDEKTLYVVDHWNNRLRKITNLNGTPRSSLVSGTGEINCQGSCNGYKEGGKNVARFDNPTDLVLSPDGKTAYVTDTGNNRIRAVTIKTGQTRLIAGSGRAGYKDGTGAQAEFHKPVGISINQEGTVLYVADQNNHRLRKIVIASGQVSTVAGSGQNGYQDGIGTSAILSLPSDVEVGDDGNLYLSEAGSHRLRFVDPQTGSVRTIAGSGVPGRLDAAAAAAKFHDPKGLAVDTEGNRLYVADYWNDLLRSVSIPGEAPFFEPAPTLRAIEPQNAYLPAANVTDTRFLSFLGSEFRHGAKLFVGGLEAVSTFVVSGERIDANIPVGKLPTGYHDVLVRNADGQEATLSGGFIVLREDGSLPPEDTPPRPSTSTFFGYDNLRGNFTVSAGNIVGSSTEEVVQGTGPGLAPQVRFFSGEGEPQGNFFAFAETLRSGVRLAPCNVDNRGKDEVIVSAGPPGRPHIRLLDALGAMTISAGFFALDQQFQGGTNVACGELNGGGQKELLVAASRGGGPHVTVHKPDGSILANFFAYDRSFRGGVNMATADLNGDGTDEIITAPEFGAPHIQSFRIVPGEVQRINPGFYAFHPDFRGGLSLAGGDLNGDGEDEYVVGQRTAGQAWVKIYDRHDTLLDTFLAYRGSYEGGVSVAMGDVDGDGNDEVITMPTTNALPEIKVFDIDL